MNTDKIYAEQLANEYAPKDTSKIVAPQKLDAKAKRPANFFTTPLGVISPSFSEWECALRWNQSAAEQQNPSQPVILITSGQLSANDRRTIAKTVLNTSFPCYRLVL